MGLLHLRQLIILDNFLDQARLPRETFAGLPYLQLLDIANQGKACEYPVGILEDLKELRTLSVTSRGIPLPNVYGRLPKLTTIVLDGYAPWTKSDKIIRLAKYTFPIRDSNINTLMIHRGNIKHIEGCTFSNFKNLHALNLGCNRKLNVIQAMLALDQIENITINTAVLDGRGDHGTPLVGYHVQVRGALCSHNYVIM